MESNLTLDPQNSPLTLWHAIEAAKSENRNGLVFVRAQGHCQYTWSTLALGAAAAAGALRQSGLEPRAVCAIIASDPYEFVCVFLATLYCGALPMAFGPAPLMSDVRAHAHRLLEALELVGCKHAFFGSEETGSPLYQAVCAGPQIQPLRTSALASSAQWRPLVPAPDDVCLLQLSSGSTGDPKAIAVTHRNLIENVRAMHGALQTSVRDERGVSWLPLWHDMGLISGVVTPLIARSAQVLIPPQQFAASPRIWLETIHAFEGTVTATSNFGLHLALKRPPRAQGFHLRSLRTMLVGAEPIDANLARDFQARFAAYGLDTAALRPAYGLAESTLAVTISGANPSLQTLAIDRERHDLHGRASGAAGDARDAIELACCGRAVPGHTVAILDAAGARSPEDVVGEIAVAGPSVTPGVYRSGRVEAHSFVSGLLRTGDLGFLRNGELYVTGRIKDLIIIAGRNVHPQQIEWCVAALHEVRTGAVIAFSVPGRETERLVVLAECETPRAAAGIGPRIHQYVARELGLAVADVVVVRPFSLPKTSSGKLRRARAKALYLSGGLDRIAAPPSQA